MSESDENPEDTIIPTYANRNGTLAPSKGDRAIDHIKDGFKIILRSGGGITAEQLQYIIDNYAVGVDVDEINHSGRVAILTD